MPKLTVSKLFGFYELFPLTITLQEEIFLIYLLVTVSTVVYQ